jgi:WD40 repeat protein
MPVVLLAIIIVDDSSIYSCSDDNTIKVWNTDTGVCELTLEGPMEYVNAMVLQLDRRLCSVSKYGNLIIWKMEIGYVILCSGEVYVDLVHQQNGRLAASNLKDEIFMIEKLPV